MDIETLRNDRAVKDWFTLVKPSKSTEINYLRALRLYCNFTEKSPSELIEEAEDEEEEGVRVKRRSIRRYLLDYIEYLNNSNVSPNTVKLRLAAVKSFYVKSDVTLPNLPRNERAVTNIEENTVIPTKEELQKVLKSADILERAVLLTGVSSGLASDDLRNLKVSDFKNGYDPETEVTLLSIRRGKTKVDYQTALTPEASRAVIEYLNFRNGRETNTGDTQRERQIEKQKVFSDDGYLFVLSRIPDKWLIEKNEEERKFKRNTFMEIYRSLSIKAGMNAPKGQPNLIRSHNMRRYCFSALINSGASSTLSEYLLGHKLPGSQAAYYRSNPEDLKREYMKYVPYLTIQKEADISESPEFKKLKEDNQILATEAARASVERAEIQELRKKVQDLENMQRGAEELYRQIWNSEEGFKLGMQVIKKLHPKRIILPPSDGTEEDEP